jgi:hypothetical protein
VVVRDVGHPRHKESVHHARHGVSPRAPRRRTASRAPRRWRGPVRAGAVHRWVEPVVEASE